MDPLKLRKLGRSDLMLPQLGFGGAPLGDLFVKVAEGDAEATLATAWAEGIRYYDTAPLYGHGQSEHRIGRLLYRQPRNDVILSTKVGRVLRAPIDPAAEPEGWVGGLKFEAYYDYSYDGIMRSFEDSLQRLGMTQIDALVIHDLDLWHHTTEARVTAHLNQLATSGWRALAELKAAGRIRAVGAGINELWMIRRFVDLFDLDFFLLALRYTLGDHSALELDMPLLAGKGIGVVIGARVQLRALRHRPGAGGALQLRRTVTGRAGESTTDRVGLRSARGAARGGCAAVPNAPSGRGIGHPGRLQAQPRHCQHRIFPSGDPECVMGGAEGSKAHACRRPNIVDAREALRGSRAPTVQRLHHPRRQECSSRARAAILRRFSIASGTSARA